LIRTPNNKNSHGQNRECWIPNPSAKNPAHFKMFKFFGALIGSAIRSTSALNLDLPPTFWKQILNEPLDILNLKEVDTFSWQIIE
jgi:E3 ubiquitin-protein ligase HERC2